MSELSFYVLKKMIIEWIVLILKSNWMRHILQSNIERIYITTVIYNIQILYLKWLNKRS